MKIKKASGFSLIELMIVIAIISFLLAYALPSYNRQVIVSKRTDAKNGIMKLASGEEKHYATYNVYTTIIGGTGVDGDSLGFASLPFMSSPDYTFTISNANGYTVTATAIAGSTQVGDVYGGACNILTMDSLGQKTPLGCWQ